MYQKIDLSKTVFIDIETVPEHPSYAHLDAGWRMHWQDKWKKTRAQRYRFVFDRDLPDAADTDLTAEAEAAYREAGLYAEFGKICCITVGKFVDYYSGSGKRHFKVTSIYGTEEKLILENLCKGLHSMADTTGTGKFGDKVRFVWSICGHNVREFDVPYMCRRLLVHGMSLPDLLDCAGMRPWEVTQVIDTMELWKFGDNKNFTSLNLLAQRFGIPSPKDGMDGSGVYDAYLEGRHDEIGTYCGRDVSTLAQLLLRWRNEDLLLDEEIEYASKFVGELVRV